MTVRSLRNILLCAFVPMLAIVMNSCDVHEFPEPGEQAEFVLNLHYATDLEEWHHAYKVPGSGTRVSDPDSTRGCVPYGDMRYHIRAYRRTENTRAGGELVREFIFNRSVSQNYDASFKLDLPVGNYSFYIWSDLVEYETDDRFYNSSNFSEICIAGDSHCGNTDHRDTFRGYLDLDLVADIYEKDPEQYDVLMQRPMAKFEFVTTDLQEFIEREVRNEETRNEEARNEGSRNEQVDESLQIDPPHKVGTKGITTHGISTLGEQRPDDFQFNTSFKADLPAEAPNKTIDIRNYRVVFHYVGYMPNTYNIFNDKPVDSATGVKFDSKISRFNDKEASLGFDYVFVNGSESSVMVQIAIYDKEGRQVSLTNPIEVPLRRDLHTVMRGSFLMQESSGGLNINPDFDGDHNIVIP